MSNPKVTDADRAAADQYESLDFADAYHLAGMFAAHRIAAVEKCVEWLKTKGDHLNSYVIKDLADELAKEMG